MITGWEDVTANVGRGSIAARVYRPKDVGYRSCLTLQCSSYDLKDERALFRRVPITVVWKLICKLPFQNSICGSRLVMLPKIVPKQHSTIMSPV